MTKYGMHFSFRYLFTILSDSNCFCGLCINNYLTVVEFDVTHRRAHTSVLFC